MTTSRGTELMGGSSIENAGSARLEPALEFPHGYKPQLPASDQSHVALHVALEAVERHAECLRRLGARQRQARDRSGRAARAAAPPPFRARLAE